MVRRKATGLIQFLFVSQRKANCTVNILPRRVPGSKQALSDNLTVSILIDRNVTLEVGKSVLVLLTSEEAAALLAYLQKHGNMFQGGSKS